MPQKSNKQPNTDLAHDERGSVSVPVPHVPHPHLPSLPSINVKFPVPAQKFLVWLKQLSPQQYIIAVAIFSQLLLAGYLANFLTPKNVSFSFAGSSCSNNLVLLPRLHRTNADSSYRLETSRSLKVAGYPLTSSYSCITPVETPKVGAHAMTLSPGLLPLLNQKITIETPALPTVAGAETIKKMPTNIPAVFSLDQEDKVFTYKLSANKLSSDCAVDGTEVSCDTQALKLKQSTKYDFKLERYFAGAPVETVFAKNISTIEAITVKGTSLKQGQVVYDKPKTFTIDFSKTLDSHDKVVLTNLSTNKIIPVTTEIKGKSLVATIANDLPRQTSFALSIGQVTAPDRSSLATSYTLKFSTSGGPKVIGSSIASYGVYSSSNITLTFDSAVATNQNVVKYVTLTTGEKAIPAAVYVNGNTVTIDPTAPLPHCTAFRVSVLDGLSSAQGIAGGSAWAMNSRSVCHTESVIGSSVLGRSIFAYHFGNGPSKIIFFANMHGDEASGRYTLNSWIDELEAKFDQIPANRTIIVIPTLNPDGLASGNRYNARQVDLNRNFPDVDWQANVTVAGGETLANNGGTAPLSEPETAALANFIQANNPRLILSYHAVASVVIANEAGDSTALANTYASLSNYWAPSPSQSGGLFNYQITGTMEGWAYNVLGIPTLVIEQSTYYGNEFYSQQNALWAMAKLP